MASREQVEILRLGVDRWNEWRQANPDEPVELTRAMIGDVGRDSARRYPNRCVEVRDLKGIDLREANLTRVRWASVDLRGANFCDADLPHSHFRRCDLRGADFSFVNLIRGTLLGCEAENTDFRHADLAAGHFEACQLGGARLARADLRGALLRSSQLEGTDLSEALMGSSVLDEVDLSHVAGLESVLHEGPSTIGIGALARSGGRTPTSFLERAGVSSQFAAYQRDFFAADAGAIRLESVFISHSTADHDFCRELYERLRAKGVKAFYAPKDLGGGEYLDTQLSRAIEVKDRLLLVLSGNSMKSDWVEREIRLACRKEQEQGRRVLFPIRLIEFEAISGWEGIFDKARPGQDLTDEIRRYNIPDFSDWQNEQRFDEEVDRLVEALQVDRTDD